MKTFIIILFILLGIIRVDAQNIRNFTRAEEDQLAKLTEMATVYLNEKLYVDAAKAYNQMAFIYWKSGRTREAVVNFNSSADLFLQVNKFNEAKNIYSNVGVIYSDLEELDNALEYFEKSLVVRRKMNNKIEIAAGLIDVAFILQALKFNDEAIKRLNEALDLSTDAKDQQLIMDCYQLLALNYEKTGNIKKSKEFAAKAETYQAFLQEDKLKADLTGKVIETEKQVAKSQAEIELAQELMKLQQEFASRTQDSLNLTLKAKQDSLFYAEQVNRSRQLQIDNLNKSKEIQDLAIKEQEAQQQKQQLFLISIAGGLLLMVFLAMVMFRANRQRKKANKKLEKQNREIIEKGEQLSGALKKIAHQNQNITQSINYAKGIQRALLPKPEQLNELIKDSFILFKPRDIVSGDFYWFKEIDAKSDIFKIFGMHRKQEESKSVDPKKIVVSAVDCTGHGVPGAFMSMIGFNLLEEIVNKGITRPDNILQELHKGVRFTLKQRETNNQDGMDMALCVIDPKTKILEFAGAKNPLIYMQDGEVFQIKGDKNGIGGKFDDHEYTLHTIDISKPTTFYLFSDGYIDQFGGDNGRKFMIKTFRDLLAEIYQKPFEEQREILYRSIKEWMGTSYNQIDDILVIGFKVDFSGN